MQKPDDATATDQQPDDPTQATPVAAVDAPITEDAEVAGETHDSDDLQRQVAEHRDRYLRLAAEYDNFRKRSAKERQEAAPRAQADLVRQLLEPLDDLMRFADLDPTTVDAKTVVDGANMVEKKLLKVFAAIGTEVLDPAGQRFDPTHHEAVMTEPAASADEDDLVSRVFQVGFLFNGQLLRPARVVVKQWNA